MTSQERISKVLAGEIPDRVPLCEICFWPQTVERWKKEGLPEDIAPLDYFEMDHISGISFDGTFQLPVKVLEDTIEYRIETDGYGRTLKVWKGETYSPPNQVDHILKEKKDWEELKQKLVPTKERIPKEMKTTYENLRKRRDFVYLSPDEPCWFVLERTMGFESGLPKMVEEPDLIKDMIDTHTGFILKMCEICIKEGMKPDAIWLSSDLCYKNGMLFSPRTYRALVMPSLVRIKQFCREQRLFLIYHCDGNVKEFLPLLIEVGVDAIQPLEARAGNDVRIYKKQYDNKITFFGNISADILSLDKEKIREEVESKVSIAKERGGYIFHSDHSVPPSVSFQNYKFAVETAREIGKYGNF
ncbi:hypothetical protein COY51_00830 [Candidatus Desantisbacteria bacterium CG_4_10_14_0_8_um_filter_39_17]|uniref:Uroporphyrinogen decarboxylase (URO-D) domain-containing protein n=1 Tax=Candidatus Desantisbacteria bacterium CG_4_10_14_0_8_um_filter_39_17 TaxID=1974542 RepID=A0A2H9PCZ9_9BACT|nr:MAG: hypothetical protein COY51_00830 [Candidatus Desantisbacteria bacterium CG_4_10_14_0_8_um_filter_39_17]